MGKTTISWTDYSTNAIRARVKGTGKTKGGYDSGVGHYCERVSPGCAACYASTMQPRFGLPEYKGQKTLTPLPLADNSCVSVSDEVEVFFDPTQLESVLKRKKPAKFFHADMSDLFGSWVLDEWIDYHFAVFAITNQHTHQVLTKRPQRMLDYIRKMTPERIESAARKIGYTLQFHGISLLELPLSNVWLGVSSENQKTADERIPLLLRTPAAIRFVSYEPALGSVDFQSIADDGNNALNALTGNSIRSGSDKVFEGQSLDLIIVGGESGRGARPFDVAWARSTVQQCKRNSVCCFVKQLGSNPYDSLFVEPGCKAAGLELSDPKGGDMSEWSEDLRVRELPKAVS